MAAKSADLTGQIFGDWTVLGFSHKDTSTRWWRVRCACGVERVQRQWVLTTGKSQRCGPCGSRAGAETLARKQAELWVGTETNGWLILAPAGTVRHYTQKVSMWTCRCVTCGAIVDMARTQIGNPLMPVCRHGIAPEEN